ncbi:LysR family transcriptional regulator [Dermabacter sp. p3-SID358]|uniref:LysR family transcriptional regulator n=1 Tax=Dermabacter sp. p3-SID358 TaxID=2916114 RepID=UPI0021A67B05|nr:LysR family transcriptional regulator [Dermabacter sp. p3-SID358]MCT1867465.1 LysR family transcriptional regulator [Dermabacter sp. p3-SID358]
MDPRRLVIFNRVVTKGSIGAAARELGWTQPAVSQHIAALEKDTGMQLVVRGSGGVAPTEAGARLAVHAAAIAANLKAAETEMNDLAALKKGLVRCAAFPSAAAMLLPPTLARMDKDYPGIELGFTECEPPAALEGVRGNSFDVAMIFRYSQTPPEEHEALEWTPILADPVRLILPKSHPLATREDISMKDLSGEAWVAGCDRCSANLRHHARVAGFTPDIRYCTDDSTVAQRLVGHNTGVVALLPEIALEAYPNDTVVIKEVKELDNRVIGIVNRPGALKIPAIAAFVNTLRHNANAHGCTLTHAHVHLDTEDLDNLDALADIENNAREEKQS